MKKLKKLFMLAIIPTTILFNASFAFADTNLPSINNLQLMFDQLKTNPEFQNGQLYINAKFVTQSGLILEWNSETGNFVVGSGVSGNITPPTTTPTTPIVNPILPEEPIVNVGNVTKTYVRENIEFIEVNNIVFARCSNLNDKYPGIFNGKGMRIDNINYIAYKDRTYVKYDYFLNNILK